MRALLFDFNGVLVDDEPIHLALFQKILAEEGIELREQDYYERFLGLDDKGCFGEVLAAAGEEVAEVRLSRLIARKSAYYQATVREQGFPVFPGAAELVAAAAAEGLPMGVVSGALRDEITGALAQLGLSSAFKSIVAAEDVDAGKPDPEGYRLGLAALNSLPPLPSRLLHPHEVLAIEDSPAGLEAAAAVGLSTLGVAHTYPLTELAGADRVVESLDGLGLGALRRLFAEAS